MARIGVVLSGCGVFDGSEIHEAVSALLALDQLGAEYQCMAPDASQLHVVNHLTGEVSQGETRSVLVEAARIARGQILPLDQVRVSDYDGFVFPGGFGAAKNLSSFAVDGAQCSVHPEVERLIKVAHDAGKPLCFCCIAPVVAARVLGSKGEPQLTVGAESSAASAVEEMQAGHRVAGVSEVVVDHANRIVSTPAYMYDARISEVYSGIRSAVEQLLALAG